MWKKKSQAKEKNESKIAFSYLNDNSRRQVFVKTTVLFSLCSSFSTIHTWKEIEDKKRGSDSESQEDISSWTEKEDIREAVILPCIRRRCIFSCIFPYTFLALSL